MREVFAPVTTSVLTTMAAFSPLMLMPGIVGKFMLVVPLVVTTALAISLLEAYWMLPETESQAAMDDTLMIPPQSRSSMPGTAARVRRTVAST